MTVHDVPSARRPLEPAAEPRADAALEARARRAAADELAHAAAGAGDHAATLAALAAAVVLVEDATDAGLGRTAGEAPTVLQRRLGRALRRLDARGGDGGAHLTAAELLLAAERLTGASGSLEGGR